MSPLLPELIELRQLRLELDLSYTELALRVGFNTNAGQSVLHKLLHGKSQPSDRTLFKIRRYLAAYRDAQRAASLAAQRAARPAATEAEI